MSAREVIAAVAAVLVAGWVIWRRGKGRIGTERLLLGLALALALGVYASGLLSKLPDPKKLIGDIAETLGVWTYALVGVMAYLETAAFVGLVAPGETVVIAGGVIAGQGEIDLVPLIGLVWACAILGDTTSFYVGRRLGRRFLERHGPKLKITAERLDQVEGYFEHHGGKTILIGRFIGLVRALAPFVAGSSGLAYGRFLPFSVVGTGLWSTVFCVLGYVFWRSFDQVAHIAGQAIFGLGLTVALIVGMVMAYRRRRAIRRWLVEHERHPLLRPLFAAGRPLNRAVVRPASRVLGPRLRFLRERVTPGELGLELTTAGAVAATGLYVFVLYTVVLSGDLGPTPLDSELRDVAGELRSEPLVEAARIFTELGSLPMAAALVVGACTLLVMRRRLADFLVLSLGSVLVFLAVHVTKDSLDRPRPGEPLTDTMLSAYPSGHAAYATAWVAVAVILTRRLGLFSQAAVVTIALVIAAGVGASRVYLRVHWGSDVAGGWGLGVGLFALLGVVVLVVEYIRHNGAERTPATGAPEQR